MRKFYSLIIILCVSVIPFKGLYAQTTVKHPRKANIPYINKQEVESISEELNSSDEHFTKFHGTFEKRVKNAEKLFSMGSKEGNRKKILGRIAGVVSDKKGNIYILDKSNNRVVVYDSTGTFQYTFGKSGPGPSELRSPEDIEIDSKGNIFIADRYNAIKKFVSGTEGYEYETTLKIDVVPDSFCILGENIYVRGIGNDKNSKNSGTLKAIHQYSLNNKEYVSSFGKPYQAENALATNQLSDGILACDEGSDTIITTFELMPYVFGFSSEGQIKWVSKFNSFSQRPIIERNRNGQPEIVLKGTESPSDSIEGIHILNDDFLIVQKMSSPRGRNLDPTKIKIDTYLVALDTGKGAYLDIKYPQLLLFDISDSKLISNGIFKNLYPSLITYTY